MRTHDRIVGEAKTCRWLRFVAIKFISNFRVSHSRETKQSDFVLLVLLIKSFYQQGNTRKQHHILVNNSTITKAVSLNSIQSIEWQIYQYSLEARAPLIYKQDYILNTKSRKLWILLPERISVNFRIKCIKMLSTEDLFQFIHFNVSTSLQWKATTNKKNLTRRQKKYQE